MADNAEPQWREVSDLPSKCHAPADHPLRQYMDADLFSYDHNEFFEIFRASLRDDIRDLLFSNPSPIDRLTAEDLKKCEERRLNSYSTKHNSETGKVEIYKCEVFERWDVASAFADSLVQTFDNYKNIQHPRDEIEALENSISAIQSERQYRDQPCQELGDKEFDLQLRRDFLRDVLDNSELAIRNKAKFAVKSFAYQFHHITFCSFGDAPKAKKGKNPGRGLGSLTAKITNLLFELKRSDQISANDVSQWYIRGAPNVAKGNKRRLNEMRDKHTSWKF